MIGLDCLIPDYVPDADDLKPARPAPRKPATGSRKKAQGHTAESRTDAEDGECEVWDGGGIQKYIFAPLTPGDFESPGLILNPIYVAADPATPKERKCGACRLPFTSTPCVFKGKVVMTPLFCPACAPRRKYIGMSRKKNHRPQKQYPWALSVQHIQHPKNYFLHPDGIGVTVNPSKPPENPYMEVTSNPDLTPSGPQGHATHGPSSLKHKEICAHWRNTGGENAASIEGTRMHEALETGTFHPELSGEAQHAVHAVAELFNDVIAELGPDAEVYQERRMDVAGITWGTADLLGVSYCKTLGKVLDAKFGRIPVDDAEENLQGWCYALAAFFEFPSLLEVEVVFAQPRCDEVSRHTFYRAEDYGRMLERIHRAVRNAEIARDETVPSHLKPAFNPTPSNCQYCGFKATCPALSQLAVNVTKQLDDSFDIPAHLDPRNIFDPHMMAQARQIVDVLEPWCKGIKAASTKMVFEEGVEIPGYVPVTQDLPRSITDPVTAYKIFTEQGGSIEEFVAAIGTVSMVDLEKAVAARAPKKGKQQAKQEFEDALTGSGALRCEGVKQFLRKRRKQTSEPKQLTD